MPNLPLFKLVRINESTQITEAPCRVSAISMNAPAEAGQFSLLNSEDPYDDPILSYSVEINRSKDIDLTDRGGVIFDTALLVLVGGSDSEIFIWYS